jgi:hypothetical protein
MLNDPTYTSDATRRKILGFGLMLLAIPVVALGLDYFYGT